MSSAGTSEVYADINGICQFCFCLVTKMFFFYFLQLTDTALFFFYFLQLTDTALFFFNFLQLTDTALYITQFSRLDFILM